MSLDERNHDDATAQQPEPKLRWFQYRLRSLFILTFLVAIACSWLTVTIRDQRKQGAVAKEIERDGRVTVSEPTWLGRLLRDDSLVTVTSVNFSFGEAPTDADLARLEELTGLRELVIMSSKVTDAGLVHLRGLTQLQDMWLENTQVTDAGLVHLDGLSRLQMLMLRYADVTDAGLAHLKELNQLRTLGLDKTQITDAGLVQLYGLNQLVWVDLSGTKVTDQGVKKLQQALPNCQIVFR